VVINQRERQPVTHDRLSNITLSDLRFKSVADQASGQECMPIF
jgi:hypothetical protein